MSGGRRNKIRCLAGELAQEFLLVHAVLEGFAAVDENDWDLVVVFAPKFRVGVYINLAPGEATAACQLIQTLLDYFAEMTTPSGVNDDAAKIWHADEILAPELDGFPDRKLAKDLK